jgi:multiple sugar transport system permease protein
MGYGLMGTARASFSSMLVRAPAGGDGRRTGGTWQNRRERRGVWFVMPFMVLFALFLLAPVAYAAYLSLFSNTLIGGNHFSKLANYSQVFSSSQFWSGFLRVVIFGAIQVPVTLVLATLFALLFDIGLARFGPFFRTLFFIPFAVPAVVATIMWSFLFEPQFGPFTKLASSLGFGSVNFFSPHLILPTVIVIVIWEFTGYNMVIMYTALKAVPRPLIEAALVDGAPLRTIIWRVKLPMVRPAMVMLLFLNVIGALQLFTEPSILGSFEPQAISYSFTPTIFIYNTAIGSAEYNFGAAAAIVLGFLIFLISFGSLFLRRRGGELR